MGKSFFGSSGFYVAIVSEHGVLIGKSEDFKK